MTHISDIVLFAIDRSSINEVKISKFLDELEKKRIFYSDKNQISVYVSRFDESIDDFDIEEEFEELSLDEALDVLVRYVGIYNIDISISFETFRKYQADPDWRPSKILNCASQLSWEIQDAINFACKARQEKYMDMYHGLRFKTANEDSRYFGNWVFALSGDGFIEDVSFIQEHLQLHSVVYKDLVAIFKNVFKVEPVMSCEVCG